MFGLVWYDFTQATQSDTNWWINMLTLYSVYYSVYINKIIVANPVSWKYFQNAPSSLTVLNQLPFIFKSPAFTPGAGDCYEEDELILDQAIDNGVFQFLHTALLNIDKLHKEVGIQPPPHTHTHSVLCNFEHLVNCLQTF